MAKAKPIAASSTGSEEAPKGPQDDFLEMLNAAADRTDKALGFEPSGFETSSETGGFEASRGFSFDEPTRSGGVLRDGGAVRGGGGGGGEADQSSPDRLAQNPPEAVERFLLRKGYSPEKAREVAFGPTVNRGMVNPFESIGGDEEPLIGLERIIGKDMLLGVDYLEEGYLSASSVGRVKINKGKNGYGTGFMISPRLLITNNHVLPSADVAGRSQIEFDYQRRIDGTTSETNLFELKPDEFFVTSSVTEFDFTIVAVAAKGSGAKSLADYGYHPLTAVEDEVLAGACVSIIQHPKGDPKQVVLRDNEVLKLPETNETFLHYKAGTYPGSSGSPVFNDFWEVVALHHSGKPAVDRNGKPLKTDGKPWEPGDSPDSIKWIANEGIRLAAIIAYVKKQALDTAKKGLFEEALKPRKLVSAPKNGIESTNNGDRIEKSATLQSTGPLDAKINSLIKPTLPDPEPIEQSVQPTPAPVIKNIEIENRGVSISGGTKISVPMVITFEIGAPVVTSGGGSTVATETDSDLTTTEKIEISSDYSDREGYKEDFIGPGLLRVPLPKPNETLAAQLVPSRQPTNNGPAYELTYHHYSVALHGRRRLAAFTAVNIDGTQPRNLSRESDRWIFDPRVDKAFQIGNNFYGEPYDKGHLVRRLDPAWGRTDAIAKLGNDDTFHFTNCSPQHARFNREKSLWAGLEDYLLKKADEKEKRLVVFTGPVFRADDPVYHGVQIPLKFWKVAGALNAAGKLVAAAFLLSQESLVAQTLQLEEVTSEEVARTFQVSIAKISRLTSLDFGPLAKADSKANLKDFLEKTGDSTDESTELTSEDQISFG